MFSSYSHKVRILHILKVGGGVVPLLRVFCYNASFSLSLVIIVEPICLDFHFFDFDVFLICLLCMIRQNRGTLVQSGFESLNVLILIFKGYPSKKLG